TNRVRAMGIRDRPISPGSPWQNPYAERLIGTLRRDCLDHVLIFGERRLRGVLSLYSLYCNETGTFGTDRGLFGFKFPSRPHPRKFGVKRFLVVRKVARAEGGGLFLATSFEKLSTANGSDVITPVFATQPALSTHARKPNLLPLVQRLIEARE